MSDLRPNHLLNPTLFLVISWVFTALCHAGDTETADNERAMEEVVVVGVQPGPKMWRVRSGDNELWVFGTLTPMPKELQWDAESVDAILADAGVMIREPAISVSANPFSGVLALPSLWGIQNNPGKKKLVQIVPADLYERWLVLKEQYIGSGRKIEKYRPIFAANELYTKALAQSGLGSSRKVYKHILKLAKKYKVPTVDPGISPKIEKPRRLLKEFKRSSIDDLGCFEQTIQRLETDLEAMQLRATAWAAGDINALQALPHVDHNASCMDAVLHSSFGTQTTQQNDLSDIETQLRVN